MNIIDVKFNEDNSCIGIITDNGFYIYSSNPFKIRFNRKLDIKLQLIEPYQKTNIVFLVGNDDNHPNNKLLIWDDMSNHIIMNIEFSSKILYLCSKTDKLLIKTINKIYIYTFENMQLLEEYSCNFEPYAFNSKFLVYPNIQMGYINIITNQFNKIIKVHNNHISQIAISYDGKLIATTSTIGTIIRIWSTHTFKLVKEIRRGMEQCKIQNLKFHPSQNTLLVTSNKDTVHIYFLDRVNGYFFKQHDHISFKHTNILSIAFLEPCNIIIIDKKGNYYKYQYNDIGAYLLETIDNNLNIN